MTQELLDAVAPGNADVWRRYLHERLIHVTHEDQEHLDYFGQILRSRFRSTDTWLRTADGWRLLSEHADVFFAPGQPRTQRIFLRDAAGKVTSGTRRIAARIACRSRGGTNRRDVRSYIISH